MIRFTLTCLLALFIISPALAERAYLGLDLAALEGHKRVILLFTPSVSDANFTQQINQLNRYPTENSERDLMVFTLTKLNKNHQYLFDKFKVEDDFTLILLGKDGGEKLRETSVTPPTDIHRLIDSMPMRQWEMELDQ